jgi:hypothetical protein
MKAMRRTIAVVIATATWVALTSGLIASEELNRAKELYRAASYDEALMLLESLPATGDAAELAEAREYRVLCLVALDRRDDAEKVMGELITADPRYMMSETEASPRVRAMFSDVRRGLLPTIVQHAYTDAKTLFDNKDPKAAAAFDRVLQLLHDPDVAGNASLSDLATIATGFRDLSKALAAPVPPPAPPVANTAAAGAGPTPAAEDPATVVPPPDVIVAPVALSQQIPAPQIREEREWDGEMEVTIDPNGKVAAARMTKPIHPVYDQQLVRAAMNWTYRPAQRDGTPTQFIKLIPIHVDTRPACSVTITRACREPEDR